MDKDETMVLWTTAIGTIVLFGVVFILQSKIGKLEDIVYNSKS